MAQQGIATGGAYGDRSRCLQYPFPECSHHTNGSHPACPDTPYNAPTCFWKCDADSTDTRSYDAEQAAAAWSNGRLGGAVSGHHGLLRLHLEARGGPPHP